MMAFGSIMPWVDSINLARELIALIEAIILAFFSTSTVSILFNKITSANSI